MRKTLSGMTIALVSLLAYGSVSAQSTDVSGAHEASPWLLGLGALYTDRPYTSFDSDEKTTAVPLVFKFSRRWFIAAATGGFRLLPDNKDLDLDIIAKINNFEYESGDSPALTGMSDRDRAVEAGISGKYKPGKWGISAYWVADISDEYDGSEARASISYGAKNGSWTANYVAGAYWRSDDLLTHYFGVTASEALAGRPFYEADSEVHGFVSGTLIYDFQAPVSLWMHVNYQGYGDEVEDSPIVSEDNQLQALVGLTYRF